MNANAPTPPTSAPPKTNWATLLVVLLAPVITTMLIASFKSSDLSTAWVLGSSSVAGVIAGIMLSRQATKSVGLRILLGTLLAAVLAFACLISCFIGCGLAGGGGVRIGG